MVIRAAFEFARNPKAAQEFQAGITAIQSIMTDATVGREEKRQTLNMMVNELGEKTFKLNAVAHQILEIINMQEDVCQEYKDTESQVEGILGWLPRMESHRKALTKRVKESRKQYGLIL